VITRECTTRAKIGVFGIGLAAYWPQFDGLKERLEGYQRQVETRLASLCGQVVSARRLKDDDHVATCKDGNRYRVFINAQGKVVAQKQ